MINENFPLYIEMAGPSGVGKTTVLRLVAKSLGGRKVYIRGGLKKRKFQNVFNTALSWWRIRPFIKLYRYLRVGKNVPRGPAMQRAAAITGIPAWHSYFWRRNSALLVEEGPLLYLTGCGGYGDSWSDWVDVFLPDRQDVQVFFIVLKASPEEILRRRAARGQERRKRTWCKGTEGMTDDLQEQARRYWLGPLSEAGAHCLEIDTEERSEFEIAQMIADFVQSPYACLSRHGNLAQPAKLTCSPRPPFAPDSV